MNIRGYRTSLDGGRLRDGPRAQVQMLLDEIYAAQPPRDHAVARCIDAWCDLSTTRSIGMVVGPIPWTAIVLWCDRNYLDDDNAKLVTHVIRTLDVERAERDAAERTASKARGTG